MMEKVSKIIFGIFSIAWVIIIFTEYLRYNPNYEKAIQYFQYTDLLLIFIGLGGLISWKLPQLKNKAKYITGLSLFGVALLLDSITMVLFYSKIETLKLGAAGLFSHLGHFTGVATCTFLIYLVGRVLGNITLTIFPPKVAKKDLPVIEAVTGIMILIFLLFFLGLFGLLNKLIVWSLMIIILVMGWRQVFSIIKKTLFKPINIEKLNAIGVFSFLFLIAFITFNFAQILRPFPLGNDAILLYVNLPKLISEYEALVPGYPPYNWSLLMSLGKILFGRIDVLLALSFLGGFLALTALFQLARKWLDINYAGLCLLLFFSVPMINFLSYSDMKTDMGLLFVILSMLLLFYNWIVPSAFTLSSTKAKQTTPLKNKKKRKEVKKKSPKIGLSSESLEKMNVFFAGKVPPILKENRIIILMGCLAGFAFGIKLTALFAVFAFVAAIWYAEGGIKAGITAFFLVFGVSLIVQLDANSQLRAFHQSATSLQWILLGVGVSLTAYLGWMQKNVVQKLIRLSLIFSLFFMLPVLPWVTKNFSETNQISINGLLYGKSNFPGIDYNKIKETLIENPQE